jgi:putative hydrolases of HD superfamily
MINDWPAIFNFMAVAGKLKYAERFRTAPKIPRETIGAHSWRLTLLVMIVAENLKLGLDKKRIYELATAHDLVEALSGDIDYLMIARGVKTKTEKYASECQAMEKLRALLPVDEGTLIAERWHEYADRKTPEAKFVYALDKIEALVSIAEAGYQAFEDTDHIVCYADESVSESPELIPLLRQVKNQLKTEYAKGGWPWLKEYDVV